MTTMDPAVPLHCLWEETAEDDDSDVYYTPCSDCCLEFTRHCNSGLLSVDNDRHIIGTLCLDPPGIKAAIKLEYCPFCGAKIEVEPI